MKKYELTDDTITLMDGRKLYRIRALKKIGRVSKGDLGGYVEKEENLSHDGNCWIYDNARIYGRAKVYGDATVNDNAWIYGNAKVSGNVDVDNNAQIYGNATVRINAKVYDNAKVYGNADVCGNAIVYGNAEVWGDADVYGNAEVWGDADVYGNARIHGDVEVCGDAAICDNAGYACIRGFGSVYRKITFFRQKNNSIGVKCGCFYGTIDEFRNQVKETHKESKFAKEYLMLADLMEYHFRGK